MHTDLRISLCATAVAEPTKSTHQRLSRQSFSLCNPARTPRGIPIRLAALRVVVFGFHFTFSPSVSLFLSLSLCVYEKQLALFIIVIISTATSTTWSDLCFFHPVGSYDGYGLPVSPTSPISHSLPSLSCLLQDACSIHPSTCSSSSSSRRHLTLPAVCLFYLITSQGDRAHNTALIYFN